MVWVRASFLPIVVVTSAIALSGCMQTTYPAAVAPASLDSMAYGGPAPATAPVIVADNSGGGAISALRRAVASSPRTTIAQAPMVYTAPMPGPVVAQPVAYDSAYHLDAGDKLRVVVYGQEGLTNTYAIDAAGSITMPLIGAVPARGRTPARSRRNCATAISGIPRSRSRSTPIGRSSSSARCRRPVSIPTCPT
jgi:polysaccharide export outer membrane protein